MRWSVTKIEMCGFPKYACGHTYILLSGDEHVYLAHLGIANKNLPFPIYWWCFLFSNTLISCIRIEERREKIIKLLGLSLVSKCTKYEISNEEGKELLAKIQKQSGQETESKPYAKRFLLYGKDSYAGIFFGKGENCKNWADTTIEDVKKGKMKKPVELVDLIKGLEYEQKTPRTNRRNQRGENLSYKV